MGKGDKKSRKGKIWRGSYGNSRPRKGNKVTSTEENKTASKEEKTDKEQGE
jgi:30S ribosomal protein S31